MSVTIETAVADLKTSPLVDPSTHLKPGGRTEVLAEIERWKSLGLSAHVLVVDPGDPFVELMAAFDKLGLDPKRDLLLIFNTRDWVAKGWDLSDTEIQGALGRANGKRENFAHHLIAGLDQLARVANPKVGTTASARPRDTGGSGFPVLPVGIGLGIVGGVVGLAIMRRNRLAKEGLGKLGVARASAERAYTDLILACEDLSGTKEASEIQLRATEIKRRMDTVVRDTEAKPATANDPVTLGKIQQFENELAALRSTVLQKEKS